MAAWDYRAGGGGGKRSQALGSAMIESYLALPIMKQDPKKGAGMTTLNDVMATLPERRRKKVLARASQLIQDETLRANDQHGPRRGHVSWPSSSGASAPRSRKKACDS